MIPLLSSEGTSHFIITLSLSISYRLWLSESIKSQKVFWLALFVIHFFKNSISIRWVLDSESCALLFWFLWWWLLSQSCKLSHRNWHWNKLNSRLILTILYKLLLCILLGNFIINVIFFCKHYSTQEIISSIISNTSLVMLSFCSHALFLTWQLLRYSLS